MPIGKLLNRMQSSEQKCLIWMIISSQGSTDSASGASLASRRRLHLHPDLCHPGNLLGAGADNGSETNGRLYSSLF